ncbi:MFS transporter [Conexivisphaera calida]|uniref:Predicted thiamin transporter ThiT n=1 Tax=Conexivisphaera calida TaxID=1874277 RepID=A0A4P2VD81_9ARCH|nr:MFS transporter [Conexivisphaera calida]BBE42097.1 Predicted thiamin transporter ThiT [Conexivisphaera calida]
MDSSAPRSPSLVAEVLPWSRVHTISFATFAAGAALEAYVYALSYVAVSWAPVPRAFLPLLAIWSPLWILSGGVLSGVIADRLGRRRSLYVNYALYISGAVLLSLASSFAFLLFSLSLLLFAAGGEYNSILTASHELFPRTHRAKALALGLNFANAGGIVVALLSWSASRVAVAATAGAAAVILLALRLRVPESVMWLERRSGPGRAELELRRYGPKSSPSPSPASPVTPPPSTGAPSSALRFIAFSAMGWSYTAAFTMVSLALGPYFMPTATDALILVASAAAFASGLLGFLFDRVGRRLPLVVSSSASLALLALLVSCGSSSASLFWPTFAALNASLNVFWLLEDVLKSEAWPVPSRGTLTALVRASSLIAVLPIVYLSSYLSLDDYLALSLGAAAVGLVASIVWYRWGVETGRGSSVLIWDRLTH